jgi:protein YibB
MSNISIVTAFFDIGRGDWTPDKGHPHYLQRSADVYLERFGHLATLENDLVVFTSADLVDRVVEKCLGRKDDKTKIIVLNPQQEFSDVREQIVKVQANTEFQAMLNPAQAKNPEYWNPDYVLVTDLKAHYTNYAVKEKLVEENMVAWIDFGYCRSAANIPPCKRWEYDFNPDKIHLFSYKDYPPGKKFREVVANNDVFILGAKVVAHRKLWKTMEQLMWTAFDKLQEENMVDDDQGLWLLSYLMHPEIFELHTIPDHQLGHDPFVLFNAFNSDTFNSAK